jgi:uncharacterized iron-regulated protein
MGSFPPNAIVVVLALAAWGCGGTSDATRPAGSDSVAVAESEPMRRSVPPRRRHRLPPDVVERAARDFSGLRADGEALSPDELFGELARANVLCIGDDPTEPHHHWMELTVARELNQRAPARGIELGLGLTVFSARDQRWLDQYAANELGERGLLNMTHFDDNSGLDFALYRPLVEYAMSQGVALVGLNAPSELLKRVASDGLETLSQEEVESLAELDIDTEAGRRSFDQDRRRQPSADAAAANAHAAEVVSEETVAEHASRWVNERRPARQLLVLARTEQCKRTAIPERLVRRDVRAVVSLCPVVERQGESPPPILEGFDYGFVMAPPGSGATTD